MAGDLGLEHLYHTSYRHLLVQMYAICGDAAEAEDAVQDAFMAALRKQRELRWVTNPEAWVRTAALNRLRNTWRHASVVKLYRPKVPGPQTPVEPSPEHVAAQRCLKTTHAVSCPATHGIEPLAQTDAVFGFGDFEEKRTPYVLDVPGLAPYRALMIAGDGVEYLVDRAVIAADDSDQLVVRLPASDGRRIVGFGGMGTPEGRRCVDRLGEPFAEEVSRICFLELRLRIDGVKPTPDERYATGQSAVPAGEEHVVTVDVVEGDHRFVRPALLIWEERR